MNYRDVAAIADLCRTYGVIEVVAAIKAHCDHAVDTDYKDNPEAIIHQYAPVVNAAMMQLVNIRSDRVQLRVE
jgi:hypothetical protein